MLYWVIFGVVLIIAEAVIPGLVTLFLGMAALLTALAIHLGWIAGFMQISLTWMLLSIALVLSLRSIFAKMMPGDTRKGNLNEDLDAFGHLVPVVWVDETNPNKGRISFRGTTWDAESFEQPLVIGGRVRLLSRENLVWVVEHDEPTDP